MFVPALLGYENAADDSGALLLHIIYVITLVCSPPILAFLDFAFSRRGMPPPLWSQVSRKAKTRTRAKNTQIAILVMSVLVAIFLLLWLMHAKVTVVGIDRLDARGRFLSLLLGDVYKSATFAWLTSPVCGFFLTASIYLLVGAAIDGSGKNQERNKS
jgi:hypothetical protein